MQVGHVKAPDPLLGTRVGGIGSGHVAAAAAAHALVAARAEGARALAGQDHDADRRVLSRVLERV